MREMTRALPLIALIAGFITATTRAQSVSIAPRWQSPGVDIPQDFLGLSFETKMVLPDANGQHFFRGDNAPLVAMFRSLGIKSLRIGGNTVDYPDVAIPSEADIDALYAFADAADVRVIYSVRLKDQTDPTDAARLAKYLMDHHAAHTAAITIGNEPNVYFKEYTEYRAAYEKFARAIAAAAPTARITGPSATPGKNFWSRDLVNDVGGETSPRLLHLVTQHSYPGGNAQKLTDPAAGREMMLSPKIDESYQKFYDVFVPAAREHGLPYRLEESNSMFHGGASGVSNSFACALWGLDFAYWWAEHGAVGVNFHTGNHIVENERQIPGGYDTFWTTPNGFKVHPIGYALKAFSLGGHGRIVPAGMTKPDDFNLVAYAIAGSNGQKYVTIINREIGEKAREATVELDGGGVRAELVTLAAPRNDEAAIDGVTLGDSLINREGAWEGRWQAVQPVHEAHFVIHVPPTSAVVVKIDSH
jgi:hypothetical protein